MSEQDLASAEIRGRPDVGALSQLISPLLQTLGTERAQRSLTADEVLIFLAIGHLGLTPPPPVMTMRPTTYQEISRLLAIPKETVRRKTARLVQSGLAHATPQGIVVKDVDQWCGLVRSILKSP